MPGPAETGLPEGDLYPTERFFAYSANMNDAKLPDVASPRNDESGRVVAAWQQEIPDLDMSPMLVFSRLSRLSRHFDRQRRHVFTNHGLEPGEFDVLAMLRRGGPPYAATPSILMNDMMVSSGTMTNRIDRLQSKGLVERHPSPQDRRVVLVKLTDSGRERVEDALTSLLQLEKKILSALSPAEREELANLLHPLLLHYETTMPTPSAADPQVSDA